MTTKLLSLSLVLLSFFACNSDKGGETVVEEGTSIDVISTEAAKNTKDMEAYALMEAKCFSCHSVKPGPFKKSEVLGPPMRQIYDHYKPTYASKKKFVAAIIEWVNNPLEAKTLMPGAIRKFKLMPKSPYEPAALKLIAEALFDFDFDEIPDTYEGEKKGVQLNNGKKWKLKAAHIKQVKSVTKRLEKFKSDDLGVYIQLGRNVFNSAKTLLLDKSYSDELFNELDTFFNGVEGHIHLLIAAQSVGVAQEQLDILKNKFSEFDTYFE